MKILRIYTRLPPLKGGMEKHIYHLSQEQIKLGHDVTIYFNQGDKTTNNDVQITKYPLDLTKPRALGILIFYFFIVFKLVFKKDKFDVVHIHGDWSSLVFSRLIKKLTNANVLAFSIHDDIKERGIYKFIFSILLKQVDIIFSTGFAAAEKIIMMRNKKVVVQPSGINKIFFNPHAKKFNSATFQVITVANLVAKKNLDLVLDIAKELKDFNFIIVGDGEKRKHLQNRIENESIKNLTLLGFCSPEEIRELYKESDLFLLTSFKEGTPTSILEAMASGLPIISSNAGGIKNIIKDGVNGFIVDGMIKQRYINILIKCKDNLENDIYKNNIELANNYSWKNVSLKITNVLSGKLMND